MNIVIILSAIVFAMFAFLKPRVSTKWLQILSVLGQAISIATVFTNLLCYERYFELTVAGLLLAITFVSILVPSFKRAFFILFITLLAVFAYTRITGSYVLIYKECYWENLTLEPKVF
ncbi:MAG: hypothetical protein EOP04_15365 [Proteobacteria bacterium]|nr:MAG: hypothetical protein EOP04_15365 [Pseudomonadota bacterium]